MASIYIIKSKTSGKCYVGQTNSTAEKRWKKHLSEMKRREGCRGLYNAIRKYGVNDFEIKTVETGNFLREELNELEKKYIKENNSLSPNGYNLMTGGGYCEMSEETRKLKSERMMGRKITWGDKVSVGVKKLWEDPVYRATQTLQRHEKRGKYRSGIKKPLRLKLDNNKIQEMYKKGLSINKIAIELDVCWYSIQRRIKI